MTVAYLRETQQQRSKHESRVETWIFTHPTLSNDNLQTVLNSTLQHFLLREWKVEAFRCVGAQVCMSIGFPLILGIYPSRTDEPAAHLQEKPVQVVTWGCVESVIIKLKQVGYACKNLFFWIKKKKKKNDQATWK